MKISREVKTALLVILGILFFIFGFNYLKGENIFKSKNTYYTQFDYNALSLSSPVTIRGNKIGKINEIKYDFETGKTRVEISVDNDLKFPKDSKIRMYETGLMGGNALAIVEGKGTEIAVSGDFIPSVVEEGLITGLTKNFSDISSGLDGTLQSADSLLINLNGLVTDDSEQGLKNALAEFNTTLKSFQTLAASFNRLVTTNETNLDGAITNFNKVSEDLAVLSGSLKEVDIAQTVGKLDQTLNNVNGLLNGLEDGEGSMGKLLKDEDLYNNLEIASEQLRELLQDFKLNPKRYIHVSVFGRKAKEYTEPEDPRQ
ncbi:MlaD family protein [Bizionia paragorgiae]|uniref:Phospholipid/cholesterol/gamma-HCH transport system substrate-binding protein n=1 Tax=Bizionia paragorgiae TaxID=283786 RepID=A0A1H3WX28_BIZPA|nr:MlaD family protein [Bizionia paragorgiae]MDX1271729.1 MlaD family protein [Bizionia paragorgiae]SDZ91727.1 phospholipid/cholesterol/gamma-HCH transport system substrate-binding protein [Bizionia paragorgiae]